MDTYRLLANGRSSDFFLENNTVFPDFCKTITDDFASSDTVGYLEKGFTATGIVADFHCVLILAPFLSCLNAGWRRTKCSAKITKNPHIAVCFHIQLFKIF